MEELVTDVGRTDGAPPGSTTTAATPGSTTTSGTALTTAVASRSTASSKVSTSSASGGGGGGGEEFEGEATFYAPGLGSCGIDSTDADFVAALSKVLFDATGATNSNNNPYCGRKALVKAAGGSKRRWQWGDSSNITGGLGSGDKTRNDRLSRRSAVSLGIDRSGLISFGDESNSKPPDGGGPPMPGITPPPTVGPWKRQAGGGGVTITIVDRCPVCAQYDLDLSPAAYNVLGDPDAGRIPIQWSWLD